MLLLEPLVGLSEQPVGRSVLRIELGGPLGLPYGPPEVVVGADALGRALGVDQSEPDVGRGQVLVQLLGPFEGILGQVPVFLLQVGGAEPRLDVGVLRVAFDKLPEGGQGFVERARLHLPVSERQHGVPVVPVRSRTRIGVPASGSRRSGAGSGQQEKQGKAQPTA